MTTSACGKRVDVLDLVGDDVVGAEVRGVGGGRVGVHLDGEDRFEAAGVDEAAGHPAASGEEVDQPVPATLATRREYVRQRMALRGDMQTSAARGA